MMTQPPPAPAPAPPAPPALAPRAVETGSGVLEILPPPRTAQELAAIRSMRSELSNQLVSASGRREEIARELRREGVEGADRAGLEDRLRLLDERIVRLEADIANTGRQITSAPASLVAGARVAETFGGLPPAGIIGGGIVFTLAVLAPVAVAYARHIWRRAVRATPGPVAIDLDRSPRLDRLETAVDAIAVEIERVAEGQRFVTRLLSEARVEVALPRAGEPAVGAARAPRD